MSVLSPVPGSYAVISLDPVASLKNLNDPVVGEECQKISCGKYVACLTEVRSMLTAAMQVSNMAAMAMRYCPYRIDLVARGLPPDDPERFFHHNMSIPILPNSLHPLGRRPIRPTPPLPWDNCYHAVHYHTEVRCPMGTSKEHPQSYLSLSEAHVLDRYILNDDSHAFAQEQARDAGTGASFPPVPEMSDDLCVMIKHSDTDSLSSTPWWLDNEDASSGSDYESSETPSATKGTSVASLDTDADIRVMESLFGPGMRPNFLPIVQFSYDLTEFSSPPHPSGFFQELSQLKRILADHEKREEQKIAELLRQDDEYYSRLQADSPQSSAPSRLRRLVGWARDARAHDLMFRLRKVCHVNPQRLRLRAHIQRGRNGTRSSAPSFLIRDEIVNLT
ncbi:hypothetical protein GGG16DRAFT_129426 [Schizophyllum commune]